MELPVIQPRPQAPAVSPRILAQIERPSQPEVDLASYDVIILNSSGGKDSQAMMDEMVRRGREAGVLDRMVVVHADLGREEWDGVREVAEAQAKHYGLPFRVVRSPKSLLEQVRERGMWPSSKARYCTSHLKRDQIAKVITALVNEKSGLYRKVRVLNCMGLRAQESPARAKKEPLRNDERLSNGKRVVDVYLSIHHWSVDQVWAVIRESGAPHHFAYDLGMPRLSCVFCIFAPKNALLLAGYHNRGLLAEYVAVEKEIGHTFRQGFEIASIEAELEAGFVPGPAADWQMA